MSYDVFTGILKMNLKFTSSSKNLRFTYDFDDKSLTELKIKYPLESVSGNGDDFSRATSLLHWVSENIFHNGSRPSPEPMNALALLEYAYQKGPDFGINCRAQSIILTECLLAIGLKARTLYIFPYSPYDCDNHVVTHVFMSSMNKWIMLDPTYDSYVMDDNGTVLNAFEVRDQLASRKSISFNAEMNYNGSNYSSESYKEYLAKDLFYFVTTEHSCFNGEKKGRRITIVPVKYDVKMASLYKIEFLHKQHINIVDYQKWVRKIKQEKIIYASPDDILQ